MYCMYVYLHAFPARILQSMLLNQPRTSPDIHIPWLFCLPPAPCCKNTMEHLSHQVPLRRLQEHVEVIVHLVHLPEIHQEPQAAVLQLRQPVQVRGLEPLEHVAGVNVLQQAFMARLLEVGDVVLVGGPEEGQPVGEELFAVQIAIDVVEEGPARVEGHVGDVHGGELLLLEVVREHAPEDR
uniref:Uncharacterized protein n=1 Tax=Arundo donax TaxID=35708 RepID=A0A0A9G5U3_ARUDO